MTKQEQIEEMAKIIKSVKLYGEDNYERKISYASALELAKYFYEAGYRKVDKDSIILTKEELVKTIESGYIYDTTRGNKINLIEMARKIERKETAKEVTKKLKNYFEDKLVDEFGNITTDIDEIKGCIDELLKKYEV